MKASRFCEHVPVRMARTALAVLLLLGLSACASVNRVDAPEPDARPQAVASAEPASTQPIARVVLPPEACTRDGAWDFFKQFVARAEVRKAYSTVDLKPTNNFDGFRIGLVDNRWVYVDTTLSEADYPRVRLKGVREGDTFRMEYVKAQYAPNEDLLKTYGPTASYTFEYRNDCWVLTAASP